LNETIGYSESDWKILWRLFPVDRVIAFVTEAAIHEAPIRLLRRLGSEQSAQESVREAGGRAAGRAYGGAFTGSTDHCAARTTRGSANSSTPSRTDGGTLR
jgi:hypothetical protein